MMQLRPAMVRRMSLDELREACQWAIRFWAMVGPDEPTASRVFDRLAGALIDEFERAVREHYGLPPRDFLAGEVGGAE